jgi:hypothetical protein
MDPWAEAQIRLAERQGLLHGRDLSPVQVKCLLLCELLDDAEKARREDRSLRQAMLSTGRFEFLDLFPEMTPTASTDGQVEEALESDGSVSYRLDAGAAFDPAEAERLLASLLGGSSSGSVTAAELGDL